jgi:membrane-associated protease RseP (regulator of RpoE activity)
MRGQYFYSDIDNARAYFFTSPNDSSLTPRQILWHLLLLLLTAITTTISGTVFPFLMQGWELDAIFRLVTQNLAPWFNGLIFSFTLLVILGAHELGHYLTCRYYHIQASLPYFIPVPPPLGVGTLGAFIKIKSPIHTRRALFDVGLSGPLAGFIFALPAAFAGIYFGQASPLTTTTAPETISFNYPLLFTLIAKLTGTTPNVIWNPIWFACWVGMLATALNLLPVGQLDGGHVVYALFGKKGHRLVAVLVTFSQAAIAAIAFTEYNWAGGFIYTIMLTILLMLRHPQVTDETEPLGRSRQVFGFIALIVFILSFMPIPLKMN